MVISISLSWHLVLTLWSMQRRYKVSVLWQEGILLLLGMSINNASTAWGKGIHPTFWLLAEVQWDGLRTDPVLNT